MAGGGLQQQASMPLAKARGLPPLLLVGLAAVSCMSSSAAVTPASPAAFAAQCRPPNWGSGSWPDKFVRRRLASAPSVTAIPADAPDSAGAAAAAPAAVASGQAAEAARVATVATVSPNARRRCLGAGLRSVGKAVLMSAACSGKGGRVARRSMLQVLPAHRVVHMSLALGDVSSASIDGPVQCTPSHTFYCCCLASPTHQRTSRADEQLALQPSS
jgi:hypothetical protein